MSTFNCKLNLYVFTVNQLNAQCPVKRRPTRSCQTASGAASPGQSIPVSAKQTSSASRRGLTPSCSSRPSRTSTTGRWERRRPAGGGRWSRGKRWEGSGSDPQTRSAWSGPPASFRGRAAEESLQRREGQGSNTKGWKAGSETLARIL